MFINKDHFGRLWQDGFQVDTKGLNIWNCLKAKESNLSKKLSPEKEGADLKNI